MNKNLILLKRFTLASTFTFSGGLAMIPMLHEEFVSKNNFMTSATFYHYVSLAQSIPGVTVVTTACLLGEKVNGVSGRIFSCIGAITPVFLIMTILTLLYQAIPQDGIIFYILTAIRSTAGIFILEAVFAMYPHIIKDNKKAKYFAVFIIICLILFNISILIILTICLFLTILSVFTKKNFI